MKQRETQARIVASHSTFTPSRPATRHALLREDVPAQCEALVADGNLRVAKDRAHLAAALAAEAAVAGPGGATVSSGSGQASRANPTLPPGEPRAADVCSIKMARGSDPYARRSLEKADIAVSDPLATIAQ